MQVLMKNLRKQWTQLNDRIEEGGKIINVSYAAAALAVACVTKAVDDTILEESSEKPPSDPQQ